MRSKIIAILFFGLCFCSIFCQIPPATNAGPVEAELLKPLNIRRLTVGSTVFARVTRDWHGAGCSLRQGSTLEATVELIELHKVWGESKLALAFKRAQCDGLDMKPMELLLSAVAQVPRQWENVPDATTKTPVIIASPVPGGTPNGGRQSLELVGGGMPYWHMELKGINHHFPMSAKVQPGDVIDIKGMKLGLGTGPNRSSVLSIKGRDVMLDAYTQFLLVPSSLVYVRADLPLELSGGPDGLNAISDSHPGPPAPVANDLEVCAPPGCVVDLPVTSEELQGKSAGSIVIGPLGYAPRQTMNLGDFTEDEALAWLGPHQLLLSFNAHRLIQRQGVGNSWATHRIVRAVLLDVGTRAVVRAVDWEITDSRRYLWPLSGNRVLVHVGNELRVYGAGLDFEKSVPLAGALAFVRIAPGGDLMAIATLRERHSPELHAELRDKLQEEPEEDIDVAILDKNFVTIAKAQTVSGLEPPTLTNEGQVVLLAQPNNYYRLALTKWDGKSTSTLARFQSLCKPELSSVAPDLLFLLSCSKITNRAEYRVLRPDGKLLMRGEADPREVGQDMAGTQTSGTFAIKAVRASRELSQGMDFKGADLESEVIRVYRADTGKRVMEIHVGEPTTSHGGYALSPDGSQLAVISASQIQFFPLAAR